MAESQPRSDLTLRKGNGNFKFEIAERSPLDNTTRHRSSRTQQWVSHTSSQRFQNRDWEFKPVIKFIPSQRAIELRECWAEVFHGQSVVGADIAAKLNLAASNFTIRHFGPSPSNESNLYILLERRSDVAVLGEVTGNLGSPRCYQYEELMLELVELRAQGVLEWVRFVCITIVNYEANRFFNVDVVRNIIAGEPPQSVPKEVGDIPTPKHGNSEGFDRWRREHVSLPTPKKRTVHPSGGRKLVLPALPLLPLRPRSSALTRVPGIIKAANETSLGEGPSSKAQDLTGRQTKSTSPTLPPPSSSKDETRIQPPPSPLVPTALPPVAITTVPRAALISSSAPVSTPAPAPAQATGDSIEVLYVEMALWSEAKQEVADLLIDAYEKSLWDILKVMRVHRGILSKEEVSLCARIGATLSKET